MILRLFLLLLAFQSSASSFSIRGKVPQDFITPKGPDFSTKSVEHKYFISDGVKLHYVQLGTKGPLIVLIHGFADFWYGWRNQIPELAKFARVVAVDLPGYNMSEGVADVNRLKPESIARDLSNLLDDVKSERAFVVGHDLGGWMAWHFAARFPERVLGLVALNSPHPAAFLRELKSNPQQKEASKYMEEYLKGEDLSVDALIAWVYQRREVPIYREAFSRSSRKNVVGYYAQSGLNGVKEIDLPIRVSALVIQGMEDKQIVPEALNSHWQWISAPLTTITLPDVRHDVQLEKPTWLNRTLKDWILAQPKYEPIKVDNQLAFIVEPITDFAPDGYGVKRVDIDGDGKKDLLHIGGPVSWISGADGKSRAIARLSGDFIDMEAIGEGDRIAVVADFLATSSESGGTLRTYRRPKNISEPWGMQTVDKEPTLHRLRWLEDRKALIGAPLFGRGAKGFDGDQPAVKILSWTESDKGWRKEVIDDSLHAIHGLERVSWNQDGRFDLLTASSEGITLFKSTTDQGWKKTHLGEGDQRRKKLRGSGEVALGKQNSTRFLAAIEPWHGDALAVYRPGEPLWARQIIDRNFSGGHAVITRDVDGDGNDEIIGCYFGKNKGVYLYRLRDGKWKKTLLIGGDFDCQGLAPGDANDIYAISDVSHQIKRVVFRAGAPAVGKFAKWRN